jgi:hypothetical protein
MSEGSYVAESQIPADLVGNQEVSATNRSSTPANLPHRAPGLYPEIIQQPRHIIPRRPPMRAGDVSVLLVPPPISTPGKPCRPRDRHRLRPQQGLPTHPIITVADHDLTRYSLTQTTAAASGPPDSPDPHGFCAFRCSIR